ncbi:hypothetical protein Tsp_07046, partial [Trichinella spiralis]
MADVTSCSAEIP